MVLAWPLFQRMNGHNGQAAGVAPFSYSIDSVMSWWKLRGAPFLPLGFAPVFGVSDARRHGLLRRFSRLAGELAARYLRSGRALGSLGGLARTS